MYFLKNELNGGECLCSSSFAPQETASVHYPVVESRKPVVEAPPVMKIAAAYRPASHRTTAAQRVAAAYIPKVPAAVRKPANSCGVVLPAVARPAQSCIPDVPQPAAARRPATMSEPIQPAAACRVGATAVRSQPALLRPRQRAATRPMSRHAGYQRPAMAMEPVQKVASMYEDTETSRPFDFEVDYGNAYVGYIDAPVVPSITDEEIYFIPPTYDRTSPQYTEALRVFYESLGYPNFTPNNGYNAPVEMFQPPMPAKYGKITKF